MTPDEDLIGVIEALAFTATAAVLAVGLVAVLVGRRVMGRQGR